MNRLAAFALAGGGGFITDAGVLYLMAGRLGLDPYLARLVSFALAVTVTWAINRTITFGPSGRGVLSEGARYGGIAVGVGLFNYLLYAGLVYAGLHPLAALVPASVAAMALSWLGYSRLVFGARRQAAPIGKPPATR